MRTINLYGKPTSAVKVEAGENNEDDKNSANSSGYESPVNEVDSDRPLEKNLPLLFEKLNLVEKTQYDCTENQLIVQECPGDKAECTLQSVEKLSHHLKKLNVIETSEHEDSEEKLTVKSDDDSTEHEEESEDDLLERGIATKGNKRCHPYPSQRQRTASTAQEVEQESTVNTKLCNGGTVTKPKSVHVVIVQANSTQPINSYGTITPVTLYSVPITVQGIGMENVNSVRQRNLSTTSSIPPASSPESSYSDSSSPYSNQTSPGLNHFGELDIESDSSEFPRASSPFPSVEDLAEYDKQKLGADFLDFENEFIASLANLSSSSGGSSGSSSPEPSTVKSSPVCKVIRPEESTLEIISWVPNNCISLASSHPNQRTRKVSQNRLLLPKGFELLSPAAAPEPPKNLQSAKERIKEMLNQEKKSAYWADLMKKADAELTMADADFDTQLMIAVSNSEDYELIYSLVERLKNIPEAISAKNKQGMNALELAINEKKALIARYLAETMVEIDAVVNEWQQDGNTLIHRLCGEDYGDDYSEVLNELLHVKDKKDGKLFDVNRKNYNGHTPLHVVSFASKRETSLIKILQVLMENGSDNTIAEGNSGKIPLFIAIESQNFAFIERMLELSPNANSLLSKVDYQKNTALHIAASRKQLDTFRFQQLIELLLRYGAQHDVKNSVAKVPKALASPQHKEVFTQAVKQAGRLRSALASV